VSRIACGDRGSITPLVLGFLIIALLTTAAAVAAGDAFVQQRGLQAVCDGAAAAAAASAVDLRRDQPIGAFGALGATGAARLADVQAAAEDYLAQDDERRDVHVGARLSADAATVSMTCTEVRPVTFGALVGKGSGVRHVVHSSAQAPLVGGQ
jgi:hypothetical protein